MEQNRNKKLLKDIVLYGIGNLGGKVVTFVLALVYTFFIKPENMGYYNTAITTICLLLPFVNLQLRESVFRFLIDNHDEHHRNAVISHSYRLILGMMTVISLCFMAVSAFVTIRCGYYILGLLLTWALYEVQLQIVRGLGHTRFFVVYGLIAALLMVVFSAVFVIFLKWNIEGLFIANILARLLIILHIEIKFSIIRNSFTSRRREPEVTGMLLKFSGPLILVTTCMWMMGQSYIYFINYFYGYYEAGLFSTAFKFSVIIEMIAVVVFQAWQETSILQFHSKDRDRYYSSVLNAYLLLLTGIVITLSFVLKSLYGKIVEAEYTGGIVYLYVLCVAQIGYALQAFVGALFYAQKNTVQMLYITLVSSIAGLLSYYLLIRHAGLTGIAIAYGVTFFFLFICYLIWTRKTVKISFSVRTIVLSALVLTGGGIIFYQTEHVLWRILYWGICMIALYLAFPKKIVSDIKKIVSDIKKSVLK